MCIDIARGLDCILEYCFPLPLEDGQVAFLEDTVRRPSQCINHTLSDYSFVL